MKRFALLAALLLAVSALATACGSETTAPEQEFLTTEDVVQGFAEAGGRPLLREMGDPRSARAWDQLGLGLDPEPALLARYGVFSVYVVKPGRDRAARSLLRDKQSGRALRADRRGIYWEKDSLSGTWVANKRYPPNLVLVWWSEKERPALDERFARLDRVLRGLVRGR